MLRSTQNETVLTYGCLSDIGLVRTENQDYCGKYPRDDWDLNDGEGHLFLTADGMGGLSEGSVASKMAVDTIAEYFFANSGAQPQQTLRDSFVAANKEIYARSASMNGKSRMGTTCTALFLTADKAVVCHIGDSRLYRISGKGIVQLTKDHSQVAEMQRRGILTKEEAENHPERSKLYRAMGIRADIDVDVINGLTLTSDEYFVLCTDGLHNNVTNTEIRKFVLQQPPQDACAQMVALARERGGQDNMTVQVVHLYRQGNFIDKLFRRSW